jgi:hypothetical protein
MKILFLGLHITTQIRTNRITNSFHESPFIIAPAALDGLTILTTTLPCVVCMWSWLRGTLLALFPSMVIGLVS